MHVCKQRLKDVFGALSYVLFQCLADVVFIPL